MENEEHSQISLAKSFRTLTKSIGSAQSSIFRCKSTLKTLEEQLIYLNLSCNTNSNNRDSKTVQLIENSPNPEVVPYNSVADLEVNQADLLDSCAHNNEGESGQIRPNRTRRSFTNNMAVDSSKNFGFSQDTNICNISGELTNLLRAQQKLISQIEKLKCEIGEKSGSIDTCLKENKFFNCKFKEIENQVNQVILDVDKIKKDLAMKVSKDRGFSPYSHDSLDCGRMIAPQPVVRQPAYRGPSQEHHFGYQDICTPDLSMGLAHAPRRTTPGMTMNFKGVNGQSTTFEDLIRKSKLEIDCNINNCRNNQNTSCLEQRSSSHDHVLMDFVSLNNQIKSLRKMAESIFKNNGNATIRRPQQENDEQTTVISKKNDSKLTDQTKTFKTKPSEETTSLLINQPLLLNENVKKKEEWSSVRSSVSDSDTSYCFCTEDQFPANSPARPLCNDASRLKKNLHVSNCGHDKRCEVIEKEATDRRNRKKSHHRNREKNCCDSTSLNCSTHKFASNSHNSFRESRKICSECKNKIEIKRLPVNRR